jgi:hypothetical protein
MLVQEPNRHGQHGETKAFFVVFGAKLGRREKNPSDILAGAKAIHD